MIGDRTIFFDIIDSTNKYLKDNWIDLPSETVVWARKQINGIGRKGNLWVSEKGGLWFSVLFKPSKRTKNPGYYIKMYSLTLYDLFKKYKLKTTIKWPNDLLINNKKICGIMAENIYKNSFPVAVIVGVGINVNNDVEKYNFDYKATSLKNEINKEIKLTKLLNEINHIAYNKYYLKYMKEHAVSILTKKWIKRLNLKKGDLVNIYNKEENYYNVKILDLTENFIQVIDQNENIMKIYNGNIEKINL